MERESLRGPFKWYLGIFSTKKFKSRPLSYLCPTLFTPQYLVFLRRISIMNHDPHKLSGGCVCVRVVKANIVAWQTDAAFLYRSYYPS